MAARKPRVDAGHMDKVQDPALRALIEAGGDETLSVILEVDLPRQQVQVASRAERLHGSRSLAHAVVAESAEQQRMNSERVERTREHLEAVLGAMPRWLSAARAFTFRATPDQLREIAALEFTRAVRLNRRVAP